MILLSSQKMGDVLVWDGLTEGTKVNKVSLPHLPAPAALVAVERWSG